MSRSIELSASVLSADCAHLAASVQSVVQAGIDSIHFDVMDMHYVPNLTFGPMVLDALMPYLEGIEVHVHLMVDPVKPLIKPFIDAGANTLMFHPSTANDPSEIIDHIHALNCKAGLVINPNESLELYQPYLSQLDRWLVMSVYPGFGGQLFIEESLVRLQTARQLLDAVSGECQLEVDGGIGLSNLEKVAQTGVDSVVIGSDLFKQTNKLEAIRAYRKLTSL